MKLQQIYSELKRRNVFKVATAYAIAGWLIIQIVSVIEEPLGLPGWFDTAIIVLVGIGFPLVLIFTWAFELTPDGIKKSEDIPITESVTASTGKKLNKVIISVLSIALVFVLIERVFFAESTFSNRGETGLGKASIAVLSFVNMSSDQENEYFSDGLSEELLNALAKIEDMHVAGRTSSFKFKGQNVNVTEIGQELGVEYILEGSVRKSGNRLKITAQLIRVSDGFHVWSETYDRELTATDIFAIQEEISRKVLNELKVQLLPEEDRQLDQVPTQDIEAYQAFLKANQFLINRNIEEIEAAIKLYKLAIQLDPAFAAAHGQLAIAYDLQGRHGNIPFEEMQRNIRNYSDKALILDSQSAEAYAALGLYYQNENKLEEALEAWLKSNDLNPNLVDVYTWIGRAYFNLDQRKKSIEWYRKGYEKDPLNPWTILNRMEASSSIENYEKMETFYQKNIRINPDFVHTYLYKGVIVGLAPFGQLDESFKNIYRAYQLDRNLTVAMNFLIQFSIGLDLVPVADFFYLQLRENYTDNFDYIRIVAMYETWKGEYNSYEEDVLGFYDESDAVPQYGYYDMYLYAKATGNTERVIPYFRKYHPGLFDDTLQTITLKNYSPAFSLAPLLEEKEDTTQAQRLTEAICDYADRSSEWVTDRTEGHEYLQNQMWCSYLEKDYDTLYLIIEKLYKEHRDLGFMNFFLDLYLEKSNPEGYTLELEKLHKKIKSEVEAHRKNVIAFLKEEGVWQEGWDEEL